MLLTEVDLRVRDAAVKTRHAAGSGHFVAAQYRSLWAQAVWKGVCMSAIASATPVSRSWSTDLNRTGSLTAADAP